MRTQVVTLALVALTLAAPAVGRAELPTKSGSIVLLPLEGDNSLPTLGAEIERELTLLGLKAQRSSLKLDDLRLAVGCSGSSVACLQDIGQSVKADGLILGTAKRVGESVELSLRWFDVKTGGDLGQSMRLLPLDPNARDKVLLGACQDLLGIKAAPSAGAEKLGGLSISASVPYVEIVFDGQPRGTVPLELRNLRAGSYTVLARCEGYVAWQGKGDVRANQITHLEIDMVPLPRGAAPKGYLDSIRTQTWIIGGVGLASLAVGIGFAAHLKAQQNHLDQTQGLTPDEIQQMKDYKETGERDALAANVLFSIGGAALLTSAVLSYVDYRRGRALAESAAPQPGSIVQHALRKLDISPSSVRVRFAF